MPRQERPGSSIRQSFGEVTGQDGGGRLNRMNLPAQQDQNSRRGPHNETSGPPGSSDRAFRRLGSGLSWRALAALRESFLESIDDAGDAVFD